MTSKPHHRVTFEPSGRSTLVAEGQSILAAARQAAEPLPAECGGRGACGKCLVLVAAGEVAEYRVQRREDGMPQVLGCQTAVSGPLSLRVLGEARLPRLVSADHCTGIAPLEAWAPWPLGLEPLGDRLGPADLGVAIDLGTTTLRLLLLRLRDGVVVGEASAYNPQIRWGADVISRIVAAHKGQAAELAAAVRSELAAMIGRALGDAGASAEAIGVYVLAGNLTMMHLALGADPAGIRQVPSQPTTLDFPPVEATALGWPGRTGARVHVLPAAGGWVGGDIVAGMARIGLPRRSAAPALYVDLGTNGEIAVGGADFAMACACSAGPAFEGGGIQCGMRADRGAIDGATVDVARGALELSVVGGGRIRGLCGSGLIALADALFRARWIDRGAKLTAAVPAGYRLEGRLGSALRLSEDGKVALWERDLGSLLRSKAAIFSGIRTLLANLGLRAGELGSVIVSGNFGRFLNLPAAAGIGLLPNLPPERYLYVDNGALEGAALGLLSRPFLAELRSYLARITYVDLADCPGYMDEFVAASFLPHTDPDVLGG